MPIDLTPGAGGGPVGEVQPQPTPFSVATSTLHLQDGTPMGVIQFRLVTGNTTLFMTPEWLDRVAAILAKKASELRSTPLVASGGLADLQPPHRGQRPGGL